MMPLDNPDTQGYWEHLRAGRLCVQRCDGCGTRRHYPRPMCPVCHGFSFSWLEVRGAGTVHSWTTTHYAAVPGFEGMVPYTQVSVDLPEGVRVLGTFPQSRVADLRIGLPVRLLPVDLHAEVPVLVWAPEDNH